MATAPQPPGDATLVRYVLGMLAAEEAERFDELSIVDGDFADRLRGIEHDLADAYARGELPADERARWEELQLSNGSGRIDQRLAAALAMREGRAVTSPRMNTRWWFGLAAAAVVILAVAAAILLTRPRGTPAPSAAEQRASPPASPSAPPAAQEPRFVALTLAVPRRDVTEPPSLRIPAGTAEARFTLRIEPDALDRFNVEVRDPSSNRSVWQSANVAATPAPEGRVVVITVPVTTLRSGLHLVQLSSAARGGDIVGVYPVNIVLE